MEKRLKNIAIKPLSTISIPCMKIRGGRGHGARPLPADALGCKADQVFSNLFDFVSMSLRL